MSGFLRGLLSAALLGVALALAGCGGGGGGSGNPPTAVVQPLPLPGPYAVACSNLIQDFARLLPGEDVTSYWSGIPSAAGTPRYVSDLLADPANTLAVTVTAPPDPTLYGDFAGQPVEFVVLVCYPTTADNPRPDYPLNPPQTNRVVPHMQTGAEAPLFADAAARYPVAAFSHGFLDSPINSDHYILALSVLASYGYVVIAPFHGDARFSNFRIDDLAGAIAVATHLDNFTALQALRPLSISAALDLVLSHPQWRDHVDSARIGGFGASMGGQTMLLLGGAGLTTSYFDLGSSWKQVTLDPRIKAAVGYIPYFGQPILPAFGRDQHGLDGVHLPFLGLSGTADTTAPILEAQIGMSRLTGTRRLVALPGVVHGFSDAATNDIFTWLLTFMDAEVRGDPDAISRFSTMGSVAGGVDDSVLLY